MQALKGPGAFEAVRLGRPVVLTGYGGQRDFLDPDLAYLLDYELVPVHEPTWDANYRPTDRWIPASVGQAASCLRRIFENRGAARERRGRLAERIRQEFSQEAVVTALLRALEQG